MLSQLDITWDQYVTRLYRKPSSHYYPDNFALLLIALQCGHDVDQLDELLVTSVSQPCPGLSLVSVHLVEYEDFFRKTTLRTFHWWWRVEDICMPLGNLTVSVRQNWLPISFREETV